MKNEMVKLFTDGKVTAKDGREFTRMCGGFGENKPMFLLWQAGELLGLETKAIRQNFEGNEDKFQEGIDFIDLKSASISNASQQNIDIPSFLKDVGYSQSKLNATKRWLAFSFAGMMKLVKIAETEESWDIYNNFLEDYFKTKVENKLKGEALEDELIVLEEHKALVYGKLIMQKDEVVRAELAQELEDINIRIVKLSSALDNKKLAEALGKQGRLSQSKEGYLCQSDFGDRFNCKIGAKMVGKLFKIVGLAKRSRNRTIPYRENVPTYAYNELIENKDVDYDVAYHWNYTECIKVIDAWLKRKCEYERFYGITDKEIMELYINNLYKKYVAEDEE